MDIFRIAIWLFSRLMTNSREECLKQRQLQQEIIWYTMAIILTQRMKKNIGKCVVEYD